MGYALLRCCNVLLLALALSSCQTMEELPGAADNAVSRSLFRLGGDKARVDRPGAIQVADSAPAQATVIEGTGRFVGEPPTGSVPGADNGEGGVTLNLVNVPTAQAAKTVLGDILAVKYTIDPAVQGQVTIQTPKPVAKSAAS